jgi:methylenetetrahydrofolate dehydrogenase (NADP+)/methenyltetrahydrofolate cyclohydrolase
VKLLNGSELADFIKERQVRAVRGLRQAHGVKPHLAIVRTNPDPVVDSYMKLKRRYGQDIEVEVTLYTVDQAEILGTINSLNKDKLLHGIIVQLPLADATKTEEVLNAVDSKKDVDGLAIKSAYQPATPMAIDWLLAGYNVDLRQKRIVIVGQGRLVGLPLATLWQQSSYSVEIVDKHTKNADDIIKQADVVVSATGVPGLITKAKVKPNAVVVDAGVATDKNGLMGDVADDVRELPDITITPIKGGVGPLTVCALFENVITAAQRSAEATKHASKA